MFYIPLHPCPTLHNRSCVAYLRTHARAGQVAAKGCRFVANLEPSEPFEHRQACAHDLAMRLSQDAEDLMPLLPGAVPALLQLATEAEASHDSLSVRDVLSALTSMSFVWPRHRCGDARGIKGERAAHPLDHGQRQGNLRIRAGMRIQPRSAPHPHAGRRDRWGRGGLAQTGEAGGRAGKVCTDRAQRNTTINNSASCAQCPQISRTSRRASVPCTVHGCRQWAVECQASDAINR